MSFTYAQLKQAIQDYTENDETSFVNNLPLFIRQAEERILKQVQLSLFRKNVTASANDLTPFLAAPSDFLAPYSLSYRIGANGAREFLDFKDVSFVQEYTPSNTTRGEPKYYAQFDVGNFILAPGPGPSVCNGVALPLPASEHHRACRLGDHMAQRKCSDGLALWLPDRGVHIHEG
jgi:hypothetical protein